MKHTELTPEYILAQIPGAYILKDKESKFIISNFNMAKIIGYKSIDSIVGLTDYDIKSEAVEFADEFRKQDQQVIQSGKEITLLDIHPYADEKSHLFLTKKKPFYDTTGKIIGVAASLIEFDERILSDLTLHMIQLDKKYCNTRSSKYKCSKQITQSFNFCNLSSKEMETLYYFLRGKSAREIGQILNRSKRTIESHLDNIKLKTGIPRKADLIMCCIENGFLNIIPKNSIPINLNISIEI